MRLNDSASAFGLVRSVGRRRTISVGRISESEGVDVAERGQAGEGDAAAGDLDNLRALEEVLRTVHGRLGEGGVRREVDLDGAAAVKGEDLVGREQAEHGIVGEGDADDWLRDAGDLAREDLFGLGSNVVSCR